jgi:hypothetical protein
VRPPPGRVQVKDTTAPARTHREMGRRMPFHLTVSTGLLPARSSVRDAPAMQNGSLQRTPSLAMLWSKACIAGLACGGCPLPFILGRLEPA